VNYYGPLQRKDSGTWDYTCTNGGAVYRVGYCAKEGGCGHATEEDACACFKRYLLDTSLRLDREMDGQQLRCQSEGCGAFTSGFADVDMRTFVLCDEHRTREVVERLLVVRESWSS